MATAAPADFLGLGDTLGRLAPGCRTDLVALDPASVEVQATWLAGRKESSSLPLAGRGRDGGGPAG
jgi:N-acetylglucosamine-6-phosphate deacetylase